MQQVNTSAYRQDTLWRYIISGCGLALIVLTIAIGAFLCYKGLGTFTTYNHSISEFLFSADWEPSDSAEGGGKVGAAIFIFGSVPDGRTITLLPPSRVYASTFDFGRVILVFSPVLRFVSMLAS